MDLGDGGGSLDEYLDYAPWDPPTPGVAGSSKQLNESYATTGNAVQDLPLDGQMYDEMSNATMTPETTPWRRRSDYGVKQSTAPLALDNDSDASWDEADEEEIRRIRATLDYFIHQSNQMTMVTGPLTSTQRTKVHSMCYLMKLSHVSILDGGAKRVMIAKCTIKASAALGSKAWNHLGSWWTSGAVDPLVVVACGVWTAVKGEPFEVRARSLVRKLQQLGLPIPAQVTQPPKDSWYLDMAMLHYTDPGSANKVAFWRCEGSIHGPEESFEIFNFDYYFALDVHALAQEDRILGSSKMGSDYPGLRASNRRPMDSTAPGPEQRADSISMQLSESSAGESSTSSGTTSSSDSLVSAYQGSAPSKRKQKHVGGYLCHADGCFMLFDRECDRRKHEKIHSDQRAHICSKCNRGFHWPKDLRRHDRRHHAVRRGGEVPTANVDSIPVRPDTPLPELDDLSVGMWAEG